MAKPTTPSNLTTRLFCQTVAVFARHYRLAAHATVSGLVGQHLIFSIVCAYSEDDRAGDLAIYHVPGDVYGQYDPGTPPVLASFTSCAGPTYNWTTGRRFDARLPYLMSIERGPASITGHLLGRADTFDYPVTVLTVYPRTPGIWRRCRLGTCRTSDECDTCHLINPQT